MNIMMKHIKERHLLMRNPTITSTLAGHGTTHRLLILTLQKKSECLVSTTKITINRTKIPNIKSNEKSKQTLLS